MGRLGNSAVLHKDLLRTLRPASIRRPFFGAAEGAGLFAYHIHNETSARIDPTNQDAIKVLQIQRSSDHHTRERCVGPAAKYVQDDAEALSVMASC